MKIIFTRFIVFALMLSVIVTGNVTASAVDAVSDPVTEEATDVEIPDEAVSPFRIDTQKEYAFEQNGEQYSLFAAELTVDFNNDGKCTAFEARQMLRISAGIDIFDGNLQGIDVSRDGRISAIDARAVLRYSARMDSYYFTADGNAIPGYVKNNDGKTCYFENNGVLATGLKKIDGVTVHFASDGTISTGLVSANGGVYFFDEDGKPVSGDKTVDGKQYRFEDGKAVTGLIKDGDWYYYFDENGVMQTGTLDIGGDTYVFDSLGKGTLKPKDPSQFRTAMIGDSIVATIGLYNVTEHIDFYGKVSLNSHTIFTKRISGSSRVVIDEIKGRGYDKVIILMGINEYGANVSTWKEQYRKIIQGVRDRAPGAEIYVHAILPVNDGRARANGYYVTNAIIAPMNKALKALAQEENCFFIDAREAIALSDGTLPYEAASDGIHPTYKYCDIWGDWLIEQICK